MTWAALERLPSTCEAATIVSTCGAERWATGVYTPAVLIVPHGPLLHPRPLTFQSTLRLDVFETVAVNRNCAAPVWVDAETFDVLRVESHLVREFEFESPHAGGAGLFGRFARPRKIIYKREDYAVRFRPVRFKDPEQTLLLPEYAEWVTVIEGARRPAFRTTISFTNYRRFRSDVKVIEDTGPNE